MGFISFRALSIRRKFISLMIGVSAAALLLFSFISTINQMRAARQATVDNMDVLARMITSLGSPPTLTSLTHDSALGILKILQADKDVERGIIFSADNMAIASYVNTDVAGGFHAFPDVAPWSRPVFFIQDKVLKMNIFYPIVVDGKMIGTLYFLINLHKLTDQLVTSGLLLLLSLALILLLVIIVSARLQRLITGPVSQLAATARKITELGDYGIRVEKTTDDEIGGLIEDFNAMLDVIGQREGELSEHRHHLEMLVKDRTEQLRQKRDEALAAAKAKSEFLANMSHEIRTPMNGIIGVLSLLKDAELNEEYRGLLYTATRSADSLLLIINDILDFSKIEAGKIEFESIAFNLRDMIEDVTLLFVEAAKMKQLDLLCFMPASIDPRVQGDPTRLRQVLTNLLSNAVKFTEKGEVILRVSLLERQAEEQLLRFSVEDTGIGISAGTKDNLFHKFTQADGSTTRKYGGTGLGLSVCKQLIELQKGEIAVESEVGKGTVFWFTLPLRVQAEEFKETAGVDIAKGRRFLVVGEKTTGRWIVEEYLRSCDAEFLLCDSGDEALAVLAEMADAGRPVSTVLLDHRLPGSDGLRNAATITGIFGQNAPEMILLSSEGGIRKTALEVGIRTIVYKPVRLSQFYTILGSIPRLPEETGEGDRTKDAPGRLEGRILLVDDEPINQKVGVAILKKFGIATDVAMNGRVAVQLVGEKRYDLVLMDIQMPEMSGFEATLVIRENEKRNGQPRVPIIAMTANALESTRDHCLAIGMDDFITKPIKPESLMKRLQPWLSLQLSTPSGQPGADQPVPDQVQANLSVQEKVPVARMSWNLDKALKFVGGDEPLLHELAEVFLQRNFGLLDNIGKALDAGDMTALQDAAHAYKGAVSHFAAEELQELAFKLEMKGRAKDPSGTDVLFDQLKAGVIVLQQELAAFAAAKA
jgi:two-component system sensor histidine kinase/response regulator